MPKLEVNISQEQMDAIHAKVRAELETEYTHKKLMERIKNDAWVSIIDLLKQFGVYRRYNKLKTKAVGDLTDDEKMIVSCYWALYDSFAR